MIVLQADGFDLYEYILDDKIISKRRFSFNIVKKGLYYQLNSKRIIEFDSKFKIKSDIYMFRKVLNKRYIGKINEVATW